MTMSEGDLAVTEIRFVRDAAIAARPAPMAMSGAIGWLRANLLSSPFNIALTVLIALLLAWAIPELVKFLLIDAVWTGTDRDACRESSSTARSAPAGRLCGSAGPISSTAPIRSRERWRVDVFFAMLAIGVFWMLWLEAPRRDLGVVYFFVVLPISSFILLHVGARSALNPSTRRCGAASW